jgi:hypothetical protein
MQRSRKSSRSECPREKRRGKPLKARSLLGKVEYHAVEGHAMEYTPTLHGGLQDKYGGIRLQRAESRLTLDEMVRRLLASVEWQSESGAPIK